MLVGDDEFELDDEFEEDEEEELDDELPDDDELCAVEMGGDMGELCSGLWLPSESSLGRELGGVSGKLKPP